MGVVLDREIGMEMTRVVLDVLIAQRQRRKLSQTQVAERMGVSPASVCRWESGGRDLRLGTAMRYAMAIDPLAFRRAVLALRKM